MGRVADSATDLLNGRAVNFSESVIQALICNNIRVNLSHDRKIQRTLRLICWMRRDWIVVMTERTHRVTSLDLVPSQIWLVRFTNISKPQMDKHKASICWEKIMKLVLDVFQNLVLWFPVCWKLLGWWWCSDTDSFTVVTLWIILNNSCVFEDQVFNSVFNHFFWVLNLYSVLTHWTLLWDHHRLLMKHANKMSNFYLHSFIFIFILLTQERWSFNPETSSIKCDAQSWALRVK